MNTVQPRNDPSSESMTQDNVQKMPTQMAGVANYAGAESGLSDTAGLGAPTGQVDTGVEYSIKPENSENDTAQPYLNISASEENRSAKFKYPSVSESVPEAAKNQYQ